MKKIGKIITINLLVFTALFFIFDIGCYVKDLTYNYRSYPFKTPITFIKAYLRTYKRIFYSQQNYETLFIDGKGYATHFRQPMNTDSEKSPILIMGCSFAYGSFLKPEESFMGKLAKLTGRPIYNRALSARGANEMLFQLSSDKFYSKVPKPEWFIYVFIPDQIRRTQIPCSVDDIGIYYNRKTEVMPNFNIPTIYTFRDKINYYEHGKYIMYYIEIMKNIKAQAVKHWGDDVKFAFIFYAEESIMNPVIKKSMLDEGFIFLPVYELTPINLMTKEYRTEDNIHPSESAWDILTPRIIEKLGL